MKLPFKKSSICSDSKGQLYKWEVVITPALDNDLYPEGVKAIFRLLRMNSSKLDELAILIDNHEPYGFHIHDKLPSEHHSRQPLHTSNWPEALNIFQEKCREILK